MLNHEMTSDEIYVEVFGYRLYFPPLKSYSSRRQLKDFIEFTIDDSKTQPDAFRKVCATGCLLIYKPRYKCFILYPKKDSLLEGKIKEFESVSQREPEAVSLVIV